VNDEPGRVVDRPAGHMGHSDIGQAGRARCQRPVSPFWTVKSVPGAVLGSGVAQECPPFAGDGFWTNARDARGPDGGPPD